MKTITKNITLTSHQQNTFDNIIKDIQKSMSTKNPFIGVLVGPAGTGKTVITSKLVDFFLKEYLWKKLRIAAPTHKALKVINSYLPRHTKKSKNFSSSTLHSFLKLKMKTVEDRITFVEDLFNNEKQQPVKILLVDECSMVSRELFEHVNKRIYTDNIDIVLFIGDEIQLPPVDSSISVSPVFTEIKQYKLTEVVRQASEDPILQKATELRFAIENEVYIPLTFEEKSSIHLFTDTKLWIEHYINNPNIDDSVLTAFTNKSVNQYNTYVRNIVNNKGTEKLPKLIDGEYIVLQEAYESNKKFINNGEVIKVDTPILNYDSKLELDYWSFIYNENEDSIHSELEGDSLIKVNIIDDSSLEQYSRILEALAQLASTHKQNKNHSESKKVWGQYWNLKKRFVDIKYSYAYTVHKLQGSTYTDVYINVRDIIACVNDMEMLYRLIYVALTRAKGNVYILQ
jgi:ATP-dependent exoDNAse (exonuclease V) alpha subunit